MSLVYTYQTAGANSGRSGGTVTLHRAECSVLRRTKQEPKPIESWRDGGEALLRKVRHGLNGKACAVCRPLVTS